MSHKKLPAISEIVLKRVKMLVENRGTRANAITASKDSRLTKRIDFQDSREPSSSEFWVFTRLPPEEHKVIYRIRLRQINNGVFIKLKKATINILCNCEPYITWEFPNLKSIRELIKKRGFVMIERKMIPITRNNLIELLLGKYTIICVED
ncbi:RP-L7e [Lepeophtheirus salmonis]|uniref:RP-L7e n=1 Tax=Lepeophtheirus salmonis TaxID=72036 RepID=A0A7R8HAF2_LEPSM|nr:RP-L7e [Lepeophtheirus salmonis]CAF2955836.1 RP-L7e [Lepeophtheirus salmonis]